MDFSTPAAQAAVARRLSANSKAERDEALAAVVAWLESTSSPTQFEYLKVWRALFYCFWMTDKRGPQLAVAQRLSTLLHVLGDTPRTVAFARAFYTTMVRDWLTLDKHRVDKFYTLIRGVTRQLILVCAQGDWAPDVTGPVFDMLRECVLGTKPNGPRFYLTRIWTVEVMRVDPDIPADALTVALAPVWGALVGGEEGHPHLVEVAMNEGILPVIRAVLLRKGPKAQLDGGEEGAPAPDTTPLQEVDPVFLGRVLFEIAADKRCDDSAREVLYAAAEDLEAEGEGGPPPDVTEELAAAGLVQAPPSPPPAAKKAPAKSKKGGKGKKAAPAKEASASAPAPAAAAQGGSTAPQGRKAPPKRKGKKGKAAQAAPAPAGLTPAEARFAAAEEKRTRGTKRERGGEEEVSVEEEEARRVRFTKNKVLTHAASVKRLRRSARAGAGEGEKPVKPVLKATSTSPTPEAQVSGMAAWALPGSEDDLSGNWGVGEEGAKTAAKKTKKTGGKKKGKGSSKKPRRQ